MLGNLPYLERVENLSQNLENFSQTIELPQNLKSASRPEEG